MYVVVDIGCIECGEPTEVIGLYETYETAEEARIARAPQGTYFDGGQHAVQTFEVKP